MERIYLITLGVSERGNYCNTYTVWIIVSCQLCWENKRVSLGSGKEISANLIFNWSACMFILPWLVASKPFVWNLKQSRQNWPIFGNSNSNERTRKEKKHSCMHWSIDDISFLYVWAKQVETDYREGKRYKQDFRPDCSILMSHIWVVYVTWINNEKLMKITQPKINNL